MSTRRELADRFAMLQRGGTLPGDKGDEMLRRMVADRAPEAKETRRDMIMRHAAAPLSEAARAHIARVRSEPIDELPDYDIPVAKPPQSKAKAVNLEVNEELRQRRQPAKPGATATGVLEHRHSRLSHRPVDAAAIRRTSSSSTSR